MRKALHAHIDRMAERAIAANIRDKLHALMHIEQMLERYRFEDIFMRRSEGQKRRFANFNKFSGGGK